MRGRWVEDARQQESRKPCNAWRHPPLSQPSGLADNFKILWDLLSMVNLPACNQVKRRLKSPETEGNIVSFVEFIGLFALYAVITASLFWQWIPHLQSALIGPPEDNMQDFWNTWYTTVAKNPDSFFLPM
jgi:hypothetical protein